MLRSQLGLHMRIIQLADEGISPCLACMRGDVTIVLPMPFPALSITAQEKRLTMQSNTSQRGVLGLVIAAHLHLVQPEKEPVLRS